MTDHETRIRSLRGKYRVALACKLDGQHEYLRRNHLVGRAIGVKWALKDIQSRAPKSFPKWLMMKVERELAKMDDIIQELADHRDEERTQP